MSESVDLVELSFIYKELNRFGFELKSLMIKTIDRKELKAMRMSKEEGDQHLRDRISFKYSRFGTKGGRLQYIFADYGRLVEIMYRKRGSRAKIMEKTNIDELLNGSRAKKPKSKQRKDTRWYNVTVWGKLNDLEGRLLYGFTEEARQSIISQFHLNG